MRRAERIHRDHEVAIGIDRLARTDQPVEPAGRALGHAAALLAGGVAAGGVMARRVAMHDQDRVVARRRQGAVSLVGEFQDGQGLPAFQPKITRSEESCSRFRSAPPREFPFSAGWRSGPRQAIYVLQDRRRPAARPSGKGIAERDGDGARGDGIRRGDRRRRPGRAVGGDPPQAARRRAQPRSLGLRAREGLGDRRAHPVRRGDRSDGAERADPRLEGEGRAARDAGHRRPVPVPDARPARSASPIS